MNHVSSNYPDATTYNEGTPRSDGLNFYMTASNQEELSEIFTQIAQSSISVTPPIELKSAATVLDVVTSDFTLPKGVDKDHTERIIVQTVPANGGAGTEDNPFVFGDPVILENAGIDIDGNRISVTNFDFSEDDVWSEDKKSILSYGNWVGVRELDGKQNTSGNKLRITIPIELKPDYSGGYDDFTNTSDSGIYTEDSGYPFARFPRPFLDFPSIAIVKSGLAKGESATFKIQRIKDLVGNEVSDDAFAVILTGNDTAVPAYTILKNLPEGTYNVNESNWSWTYANSDGSQQQKKLVKGNVSSLREYGIQETVNCVIFPFTNEKMDGDDNTIYSESVVKNKFTGGTVTSPSSTTVNSKIQPTESN